MHTAENSKYAKTHEWTHMDGDIATVGISDHAQQEIGDIMRHPGKIPFIDHNDKIKHYPSNRMPNPSPNLIETNKILSR